MKRLLLPLLLLATIGTTRLSAAPVDPDKALKIAHNYCLMQGVSELRLTNISTQMPYREFYTFVGENGRGFVLVSADDCVLPILGFSANSLFPTQQLPPHIKEWLDDYEEQIKFYRTLSASSTPSPNDTSNNMLQNQWDALLGDNPPTPPLHTSVAPLLTTQWGQQTYYNSLCPYDSTHNERAVVGCVAVAMAQVMKYWGHPTTGYGSHSYTHSTYGTQSANFGSTTYSWSTMPDSLNSSSSTTQINAVATLLYHVGVAVDMIYGVSSEGGSGAYTNNEGPHPIDYGTTSVPCVENALRYYFKYRSNAHHLTYQDCSNAQWTTILQNELNNSRPVIYSGRDSTAGHSFVCDGYNNSGLFHFNWGWRGHYDGYFAIGSLNPVSGGTGSNSSHTYNIRNTILVSIRPNNDFGSSTIITAVPSPSSVGNGTVTGGGTYTGINSTLVSLSATANEGYRFTGWTDGYMYNPRTLYANGGTYAFSANIVPLSGDTLGYCSSRFLARYGVSTTSVWGIRLPAANLTPNHNLTKVMFYLCSTGSYTLKIYTGSTSTPTLVHTQSFTVDSSLIYNWCSLTLTSNVPISGAVPIWIMLESAASYPAAVSYYAGNHDSHVWGSSFDTLPGNYSFMIYGIFTNGSDTTTTYGDTVSYCDTATFATALGTGSAQPYDWAIKLPSTMVRHRSYVSDVMLYVPSAGTYTLNIYRGSATTSITQAATQTVTFGTPATGSWQTIHLATPVATNNTQPIWIAFHTDNIPYPAASCTSDGDSNSCLVSTDGQNSWHALHTATPGSPNQSWMIRAILSNNATPSVIIDGPTSVGVNVPATFTAAGPSNTTYSWTLTGAAHSSSSAHIATATWTIPGTYHVIVAANHAGTILHDTTTVTVFGCTINSFPYTMGFENEESTACWNIIDNDGDGHSWQHGVPYHADTFAHTGNDFFASASSLTNAGTLTPDNWLVTPQLQLSANNDYTLSWFDAAIDSAHHQEHYSVYISTTGNAVANFTATPVFTTTLTTHAYTQRTVDLSAYAGQNIYIAFRHNSTGQSWLLLDDISVTQSVHNENQYTITVVSNNPDMGSVSGSGTFPDGTVTTIAANANSGYRFVQWNDGNTDAIRTITVTADATYTAYFEALTQYYTITVLSADETMGLASGSGAYPEGTTATISAQPYDGYHFVRWNDGVTDNPRTLVVTTNATYIANFAPTQGISEAGTDTRIIALPNHTISLLGVENRTIEVYDMMGRRLLSHRSTDAQTTLQLPAAGVYLVVVDTHPQRVVLVQ